METPVLASLLCAGLFAGVVVLLFLGFPVALTLAGTALGFAGLGALVGVFDTALLMAFPQRIFATMSNEVLVAVPLFVFMGVILERSRVAEDLLLAISDLFGHRPAGIGIGVCLVGALLAASTGIVGATVVAMGLISLPAMLQRGYSPSLASGTVAAAGTLGQIIPPSIVLVLLGDQIASAWSQAQYERGNYAPDAISVNDLFAGALIPGLLLVLGYCLYIALVAGRTSSAPQALEKKSPGSQRVGLIVAAAPPLGLIIAVLGSILAGLASPSEAAAIGAVGALLIAGIRLDGSLLIRIGLAALILLVPLGFLSDLRLPASDPGIEHALALALVSAGVLGIIRALTALYAKRDDGGGEPALVAAGRKTLRTTCMIFLIVVCASLFALVFRGLGGDDLLRNQFAATADNAATLILAIMLMIFLLGFVLDFLEIVYIVIPVVAPIVLGLELSPGVAVDPIWFGVLVCINLQTSFLTPPMGFSLFYLRGVAPASIRTPQIYRGVVPFVCIQLLALVLLWRFPGLATWLPGILNP